MRQGKCRRLSKHRQSLVTLSRRSDIHYEEDYSTIPSVFGALKHDNFSRHSLVKQLEGSEMDGPSPLRRNSHSNTSPDHHHSHHHHGQVPPPRLYRRASLDDLEHDSCLLAPTTENRIIKLTPEVSDHNIFLLLLYRV